MLQKWRVLGVADCAVQLLTEDHEKLQTSRAYAGSELSTIIV